MFYHSKGCLYLKISTTFIHEYLTNNNIIISSDWLKNKKVRDCSGDDNNNDNGYHITIISSNEKLNYNEYPENKEFYIIGYKIYEKVAFLVIHYPAGDKYRKKYNLKDINFHITLGFVHADDHAIDKSINCLLKSEILDYSCYMKHTIPSKQIILLKCLINHYPDNISICMEYISLLFNCKNYNDALSYSYYLQSLNSCLGTLSILKISEYLNTINSDLIDDLWQTINGLILEDKKKCDYLLKICNKYSYRLYYCLDSDSKFISVKKPRNFTPIKGIDNLYGSAIIKISHLEFINDFKIDVIINLMEEKEEFVDPKLKKLFNNGLQYHQFEIIDRSIPSTQLMAEILDQIEDYINCNKKVVIHCMGGKGRTNLVIACYLLKHLELDLNTIINQLESEREVIFSSCQLQFLKEFAAEARSKDNSKKSLKYITYNNKKAPKLLILFGLPASGKSTLSNHLVDNVNNIIRLNQDEQGKKEVYNLLSNHSADKNTIIIDRCNSTKAERQEFLDYLKIGQKAWAIVLETPIEECIYRAQQRSDHPTLKPSSAQRIINDVANKVEPILESENFDEIIKVKSPEDLNFILNKWKLPPIVADYNMELMKFPRTKHLYNLGAATREDLVLDLKEQEEFLNAKVVVQEKIDGANFGISIEPETYKVLFQNRSHYVNSSYMAQFKKNDNWEFRHRDELYAILEPGRHILFGEWLFAKHSINYTELPDYFVAFDIFDKQVGKFYSHEKVKSILKDTTIPYINTISEETTLRMDQLLKIVQQDSHYYNGKVEGIYVRICEGEYLVKRAKIVRHDFLSGLHDDKGNVLHWTKQVCVENKISKNVN